MLPETELLLYGLLQISHRHVRSQQLLHGAMVVSVDTHNP